MSAPLQPTPYIDRNGRPVTIQRVPMKGSRGKLRPTRTPLNEMSPFDRFNSTNGGGNVRSY